MSYTAYELTEESKEILRKQFPPRFNEFVGDHITINFGVGKDSPLPTPATIRVIGYISDDESIEALVTSVNNTIVRPDKNIFHITWSLDRTKGAKPVDSNKLLQTKKFTIVKPITIETIPTVNE